MPTIHRYPAQHEGAFVNAYLETFVKAVRGADWSSPQDAQAEVVATMRRFLPTDELQFLMELSIEPVAAQLGLTSPA
jgi:hypothetical protein